MLPWILYSLLALALSGVAAELIARAWIRGRDRWYIHQPYSRSRMTIATDVVPQLAPVARFEANADGERGDPVPSHPDKVFRVLVAGGSAAECYLLDQEDMWSTKLQVALNGLDAIGPPAFVGNVARSLISCRKINAILERVLPKIRSLDAVVLMVGASDMVAWLEAKTPTELSEEPFELSDYCADHPMGPYEWKLKKLALYQIARSLNVRIRRRVLIRNNAGGSIAKHRAARAAAPKISEIPDPAPMLEGFDRHLRALIETCSKSAKHVVVARQPWLDRDFTPEEEGLIWNFGQGSPYRGKIDAYYEINLVRELMERVDEVATRVSEEMGVTAVELRGPVPSDFEHYYDFLHHSPVGCTKVAEAVAAGLARSVAQAGS